MLPRVGNLLPRPRDSSESTDYFFLGFSASTSTPTCIFLSSWIYNWFDHQVLDTILNLGNPKYVWRQPPFDLTKDSHTQHKEQPQNVARVFPFILKAKHKTLHVKRVWVELEILQKKQSAWLSINRARHIYTVNPIATQFQLYIKSIYFEQV